MIEAIFNYHVVGEDIPRRYTYTLSSWNDFLNGAMFYTNRNEILRVYRSGEEGLIHGVLMRHGNSEPSIFKNATLTIVDDKRVRVYPITCDGTVDIDAQIKEYRMQTMINDAIENLRKAMDIRRDYEIQKALDEQKRPYSLNEYMEDAMRTQCVSFTREEILGDGGLGIAGEAGEVADMIKKHLYQGHKLNHARLLEELGDVLWYIAELANVAGFTLEDVARHNIEKLKERYPDGFSEEASINRKE